MPIVQNENPLRPAELALPSNRVVVAIAGGLGNQMFQYAMARRFAHVNRAEAGCSIWERVTIRIPDRAYGLNKFRITGRLATKTEAGGLRRIKPMRRRLGRIFPSLLPKPDPEVVKEPDLRFNPEILSLRGNAKFAGYWQCERYFADIAGVIRDDFMLRDDLDRRSQETLNHVGLGPSVLRPCQTRRLLAAGFRHVLARLLSRGDSACARASRAAIRFFVFSDDPAWVREAQLGGADAEIIDWNGENPERDLALMRGCRHAIIANSSFSWWGAWLGDDGARTVIAPRVWMKGRSDSEEVAPMRWLRL